MNLVGRRRTEELLTLAEAELLTKRKVATWRKDIRLRRIPSVKLGRQVLLPREAIEELIARGWRDPVPVVGPDPTVARKGAECE